MPRRARSIVISNYSHIIVQGLNREYIFNSEYFKKLYFSILKKNISEYNIDILSYCIMDNHAHMLVYSSTPEVMGNFMQKVNTSFAINYNKIKNRVGYVFRDRYYLQPIRSQTQLYNCIVYIHRNPITAKLVSRYDDYQYSSYKEFIGERYLISSRATELLFGISDYNKYIEMFNNIHKKEAIDDIKDIKNLVNEEVIISNFLKSYKLSIDEVKKDKQVFKELLIRLKNDGGMSLRKMEKRFGQNKDCLNKIMRS